MAMLKAAGRNKLLKSEFGEPSKRKYPVDTKGRAINAKARATQMAKKGKLSKSAEKSIDSKANKVIGTKTLRGTRR